MPPLLTVTASLFSPTKIPRGCVLFSKLLISYNVNYANITTYSTSEVAIGTWIDGSTLYRKIIDISSPNYNWDIAMDLGIGYVKYIHLVNAMLYRAAGYWTSTFYHSSTDYATALVSGGPSLSAEVRISSTAVNRAILTVEYTKS